MKARTWMAVLLSGVLALSAFALAGCGGEAAPDTDATTGSSGGSLSGMLNIAGSDTMVNLANTWAEAFMDANPDVAVTVKGGGSGTGIAALINGQVDFANASREMKDEEIAAAEGKGVKPIETEVGKDGIAVIVNSANPVADLTVEQLGRIYRGEIKNWKDVGGPDRPIVLLSRDSSSGTYEYFKEEVVGKDLEYAKEARLLQSSQAIVDEVKKNADAIGYVGLGYEDPAVKVLKIDGVAAGVAAVLDGSYVLSRGLYVYTNGEPTDVAKAYLEWVLGDEGQKIVEAEGFVPLGK